MEKEAMKNKKPTQSLSVWKRLIYALLTFFGGIWVSIILLAIYLSISGVMLPWETLRTIVILGAVFWALFGFWKPDIVIKIIFPFTLFQ